MRALPIAALCLLCVAPALGDLITVVAATEPIPPPFVAGARATCRVHPLQARLDHVAAAPAEAFRVVEIRPVGLTDSLEVHTNHVVRTVIEPSGAETRWTFFASPDGPWVGWLIERPGAPEALRAGIELEPHLDYISKFLSQPQHSARWTEGGLELATPEHPELVAAMVSDGAITPQGPSESILAPGERLAADLIVEGEAAFVIFAAGPAGAVRAALDSVTLEMVRSELAAVLAAEEAAASEGVRLTTPDEELNRFARQNRIWFHKARRLLPFGKPFSVQGAANQEIDVLAASPDYHGVFANDCVQTGIEGTLVAPSLFPVYLNNLDVLHRHADNSGGAMPEAVEFWLGGTELFIQPLRIGQHPEWIATAASLVLLSGDRELGERLWPGVDLALRHYVDSDSDGVNDWELAAYPEQPDTTGWQGGFLYAQAWWVWSLHLASEMAQYLGRPEVVPLGERAVAAQEAMERAFARDDGYAVWLDDRGNQHPHVGHCAILPVALGVASTESATRVVDAMASEAVWLDPFGPYRANRGSGLAGGDRVWGFMRWNYIQALFEAGRPDTAARYSGVWARQELNAGLPAPESYPSPITGITGQGYVWTAGRALRALTFGLFGLRPLAEGLRIDPKLPAAWPEMELASVPLRGRLLDIVVRRSGDPASTLNGEPWAGPVVRESDLRDGRNELIIELPDSPA